MTDAILKLNRNLHLGTLLQGFVFFKSSVQNLQDGSLSDISYEWKPN